MASPRYLRAAPRLRVECPAPRSTYSCRKLRHHRKYGVLSHLANITRSVGLCLSAEARRRGGAERSRGGPAYVASPRCLRATLRLRVECPAPRSTYSCRKLRHHRKYGVLSHLANITRSVGLCLSAEGPLTWPLCVVSARLRASALNAQPRAQLILAGSYGITESTMWEGSRGEQYTRCVACIKSLGLAV